jgi:3' terminal RNA ribose 2'-O-methyltransferase Hen1
MLLSITNTRKPATDLGFLLHKHPARCQEIELAFGKAFVFYPAADEAQCTAALLLEIDPVGMVRGKAGSIHGGPMDQYVNDRPYVASSFLSVAIAKVFGAALNGKCKQRPELVDTPLPLTVRLAVLPCRGGEGFLEKLFEPLGYRVLAHPHEFDPAFGDWGDSPYFTVELSKEAPLKEVLTHLYVLIPVLDNAKHYYVGEAELENLLAKGGGWLAEHPYKEVITRRYLKHRTSLARQALARLTESDPLEASAETKRSDAAEGDLEKPQRLSDQRIASVLAQVRASGAKTVLDLGCGDGKLLKRLLKEKAFEKVAGMDLSIRALEMAHKRLGVEDLPDRIRKRLTLFHGSLMYRDNRFAGYDAAVVMEVVEHLDPPRLAAFERVLFGNARPRTIVLTTPNQEYNAMWENMPEGALRHGDHRFEWSREAFQAWAATTAEQYGYQVTIHPIGPKSPDLGAPTQMGVFTRAD